MGFSPKSPKERFPIFVAQEQGFKKSLKFYDVEPPFFGDGTSPPPPGAIHLVQAFLSDPPVITPTNNGIDTLLFSFFAYKAEP